MTVLFSPFGNQQFSASGTALAVGHKIYTYAAGSSSPLATYTDSTGLVAQSNPIILNTLGMPTSGQIWLTSGLSYKLVWTDASDVVIKTEDNISGVTSAASAVSQFIASGLTPTYVNATTFTLPGDQTTAFHVDRRLQTTNTSGTIYSTIASSVYGAVTTITVVNDSGVLDSGLSSVSYSILTATTSAVPGNIGRAGAVIQPIDATVAANALTVTINPTHLDFRSATITSGAVNNRTVPVAISCVVPNTATLGTSSTFASRIAVLAIDNAGVVEVAVVNAAGGLRLDGTNLISTTALSTASDSANVIYSTTARTNVPYRVVGYFDITEATAGTWATAPSKIQGAGGNLESVAVRRWRNLIASRTTGVIYTVGWDEPERDVAATVFSSAGMLLSFYVYPAGEVAAGVEVMAPQVLANVNCTVGGKVSPGDSYQVVQSAGASTVYRWAERN